MHKNWKATNFLELIEK